MSYNTLDWSVVREIVSFRDYAKCFPSYRAISIMESLVYWGESHTICKTIMPNGKTLKLLERFRAELIPDVDVVYIDDVNDYMDNREQLCGKRLTIDIHIDDADAISDEYIMNAEDSDGIMHYVIKANGERYLRAFIRQNPSDACIYINEEPTEIMERGEPCDIDIDPADTEDLDMIGCASIDDDMLTFIRKRLWHGFDHVHLIRCECYEITSEKIADRLEIAGKVYEWEGTSYQYKGNYGGGWGWPCPIW